MSALIKHSHINTIRRGGLVIYPTETLYGLGCVATNAEAVMRLFLVKGRSEGKPPPVLVGDEEQLNALVEVMPDYARELAREHWPGGLTLVLRARPQLPHLLTGQGSDGAPTIAVRRSAHPLAQALCAEVGEPIVATSANLAGATGEAALPHAVHGISPALLESVDVVLDGGVVSGLPSTIIDCTEREPRLVRAGAVAWP